MVYMKYYDAFILSGNEQINILGKKLHFINGFVSEEKLDWWNLLEEYVCQPIISVRSSGRENHDEIIVIAAKGWIRNDGKRVLDYNTFEELTSVLKDIFLETENDEQEVFDSYISSYSTKKVWENVEQWVKETY